jgi:hypothetical protein
MTTDDVTISMMLNWKAGSLSSANLATVLLSVHGKLIAQIFQSDIPQYKFAILQDRKHQKIVRSFRSMESKISELQDRSPAYYSATIGVTDPASGRSTSVLVGENDRLGSSSLMIRVCSSDLLSSSEFLSGLFISYASELEATTGFLTYPGDEMLPTCHFSHSVREIDQLGHGVILCGTDSFELLVLGGAMVTEYFAKGERFASVVWPFDTPISVLAKSLLPFVK